MMGKKIVIVSFSVIIASALAICAAVFMMMDLGEEGDTREETFRSRVIPEERADIADEEERAVEVEYVEDSAPDESSDDEEEAKTEEVDVADEFFGFLEQIRDFDTPMNRKAVTAFKRVFDSLTEEEKLENVHHAVNLIGDENIACLEEILFDLSEPREVMETIYHDILNREEELKTRILKRLSKSSDHPLQSDAAEILDL